jgi:hypothetical protein
MHEDPHEGVETFTLDFKLKLNQLNSTGSGSSSVSTGCAIIYTPEPSAA